MVAFRSQPVSHAADDLVGLRAIQRPGLAVGAEYRDLHHDLLRYGLGCILDHQRDLAVSRLGLGDDVAELDARINLLELLPIDRLDDLAGLEFACRLGG